MKFLIDVCVGTSVAEDLIDSGHDVVQMRDTDKRLMHAGLIRLPDVRRAQRVAIIRNVLDRHEKDLEEGAVITATRYVIRTRKSAG